MTANKAGPTITYLTHRLSQAPPGVLDKPAVVSQKQGVVSTSAVVSDLMLELGGTMLTDKQAKHFLEYHTASKENLLQIVQAACYLCHDLWLFRLARQEGARALADRLLQLLTEGLVELSAHAKAAYFLEDPEGREELGRLVLAALGLVPEGETEVQARDRLTALDSVERARVIERTKVAQQRAREIREAMAKKAAEEAASKMTRE